MYSTEINDNNNNNNDNNDSNNNNFFFKNNNTKLYSQIKKKQTIYRFKNMKY